MSLMLWMDNELPEQKGTKGPVGVELRLFSNSGPSLCEKIGSGNRQYPTVVMRMTSWWSSKEPEAHARSSTRSVSGIPRRQAEAHAEYGEDPYHACE